MFVCALILDTCTPEGGGRKFLSQQFGGGGVVMYDTDI